MSCLLLLLLDDPEPPSPIHPKGACRNRVRPEPNPLRSFFSALRSAGLEERVVRADELGESLDLEVGSSEEGRRAAEGRA